MDLFQYLQSLPDETFYYLPNNGNAGDSLIAHATYQVFRQCNIKYKLIGVQEKWGKFIFLEDLQDKYVIFGGGGNLVNFYNNGANFLRNNYSKMKRLIILPHTINSHHDLLKSFGSNVDIICREETSYSFVKDVARQANVFLMNDVAFNLDVNKTLDDKGNLFTSSYLPKYLPRLAKQSIYSMLYDLQLTWMNLSQRSSKPGLKELNCFRSDVEKSDISVPKANFDITGKFAFYDFSEPLVHEVSYRLLSYLLKFDVINTNRLHVCIAGALLGKKVNFYSNNYYKNISVYNYSIKDRFSNVKMHD